MALEIEDGSKHSGKFTVDSKQLDGEISFAGSDTRLYVHSPEFFRPDANPGRCVHGHLHDLTHVSLFDCLGGAAAGSSWSTGGSFNFADIQPHYVLHGQVHVRPEQLIVREIRFRLSDSTSIFQDNGAFASAIDPTREQVLSLTNARSKWTKRKSRVGSTPQIAYFTGEVNIFRVKTDIGTIFTHHGPIVNMGALMVCILKTRYGLG